MRRPLALFIALMACSGSDGNSSKDPQEAFDAAVVALARAANQALFGAGKPAETLSANCPNGGTVTFVGTKGTIGETLTFAGSASATACAAGGVVMSGTATVYQSSFTQSETFILFLPAQLVIDGKTFAAQQLSVTIHGSSVCYAVLNLRIDGVASDIMAGGSGCGT